MQVTEKQGQFISSEAKISCFLAGVGAGKSYAAAIYAIHQSIKYPKAVGIICAPTFTQSAEVIVKEVKKICEEEGIPYRTSFGTTKKLYIAGAEIIITSAERVDNVRGLSANWIISDEQAFYKSEYAYKVLLSRLRGTVGHKGFPPRNEFRITTTPNGFNHLHDLIKRDKIEVIHCSTYENYLLPDKEDYIKTLESEYAGKSDPLFKQEVLAEFVNTVDGSVYWAFDREKHLKKLDLDRRYRAVVGIDFNVSRLSAVYIQKINDIYFICGGCEDQSIGLNTYDLSDRLQKDLLGKAASILLVPDSTGRAKKSNSDKTDHDILRERGFQLARTTNPRIKARQVTVNKLFHDGRLYIDPSMKELIKELEQLGARENEGNVSHLAVAAGYALYYLEKNSGPAFLGHKF